jgi:uncharacterized membrane protein YkoI
VLVALAVLSLPLNAAEAQGLISLQEAISIAQSLYPNAQVDKTELVRSAQPPYYIISLDNGRSVYINALNREIVQIISARMPSASTLAPIVPPQGATGGRAPIVPPQGASGTFISYEQALQIAQSRFPGAQPVKAKLERKGRRHGYAIVWEVKLSNGYEVYINAANGAIVKEDWD